MSLLRDNVEIRLKLKSVVAEKRREETREGVGRGEKLETSPPVERLNYGGWSFAFDNCFRDPALFVAVGWWEGDYETTHT